MVRLLYNGGMKTLPALPIDPLAELSPNSEIAALPKADLHIHQEWAPRLDRVLARREGRQPYNWRDWAHAMLRETPPGMARLHRLGDISPAPQDLYADPACFVAWIEDLLEEAAADGATLVEVRCGKSEILRPGFMELFREAERRVRARYPAFSAEAIHILMYWHEPELLNRVLDACLRAAGEGLSGIDVLYHPYDAEAEWDMMYRAAARAADVGLGVTAHAGEFSSANIAAALRMPGITRIGHAIYAASDPRLLDLVAESGATVECSLSCNVLLGAVPSYEEHPISQFVEQGIPVAVCTDNPVQMCTTIGREYALAHALGFSAAELLDFTTNAVRASFTSAERKQEVLTRLAEHERAMKRSGIISSVQPARIVASRRSLYLRTSTGRARGCSPV